MFEVRTHSDNIRADDRPSAETGQVEKEDVVIKQALIPAVLAAWGTASLPLLSGCAGGTTSAVNMTAAVNANSSGSGAPAGGPNPAPMVNSLGPSCIPAGVPTFNLSLNGVGFVAGSVVRWNGSDQSTTVASSHLLTAQIPASDIAAAGTAAVSVFNPAPGGGGSNSLTFTITPGSVSPQSIAVDPTGKFAYVANDGCSDSPDGYVSMYTINPATGVLTSIGPPVDSNDEGAHSVAVDPSGKFAYVANSGAGDTAGSVSAYTINATTGALTFTATTMAPCEALPSPGSCSSWSVGVDPSGKFVYVANEGGIAPTSVSVYTIDATTGALTSIETVAAGGRAISVAVDPTGKFTYVADMEGNVSEYTVNGTTGALTSIGTIAAGSSPTAIAIDRSGKFAYVTNSGSNNVSTYTINATTGGLTSIGTIDTGLSPTSIAIHPSGTFAYVTNSGSNNVSTYSINATTGTLTSVGTIDTGLSPTSIAIHPSGTFAYVTNAASNEVSMYAINATTGALTLLGTIGT